MLSDPLYLGIPEALVSPASVPNTEFVVVAVLHEVPSTNGTTKRKGTVQDVFSYNGVDTVVDDVVLTTGHIASKENLPYATDRTLTRLDVNRVDENGKSVTLSAAMTVAVPNGVFVDDDRLRLARMLALFVLYGPSTSSSDYAGTANDLTLTRLLNGEA